MPAAKQPAMGQPTVVTIRGDFAGDLNVDDVLCVQLCSHLAERGRPWVMNIPHDMVVTIEPDVPHSWPPRAGDLWQDTAGVVWFFYQDLVSGRLNLRNQRGDFVDGRGPTEATDWLLTRGDGLRLVYRASEETDR